MASTYSPNLRLELIGTGEQQGTWGATTNTNLGTLIEEAIGGYVSVTVSDVGDTTLTTNNGSADQARNAVLNLTGTISAARNVLCPAIEKVYIVRNATTGGFAVTFKVSGQTGVSIPNGSTYLVYVNGTDAVTVTGSMASQLANNVAITGGNISNATISGGSLANATLSNVVVVANASSLGVRDSDGSHVLSIAAGSNLTSNRVFTLTTGDAARTLDISAGNVTVSTAGAALIDDASASDQRTTLGLGTIATQNSNNVTITGGSISDITDLALADGGTGASLTDPNANAVLGWNDTAGVMRFFTAGTGISINATSNTIVCTVTGGVNVTAYTSGSGNWTVPSTGTYAYVRVWGAGGSGGRGGSTNASAGGGGGGGYVERYYALSDLGSPGASIAYAVGTGGSSRATAGSGSAGGNSTFASGGNLITAYGGGGGAGNVSTAGSGGGAGIYGAGASTTNTDDAAGGDGGGGSLTTNADAQNFWAGSASGGRAVLGGGGGGRNAFVTPNGDDGGASLLGGDGGNAGGSGRAATSGSAPGGGGGGQGTNSGTSGAGANGRIEIWVW